MAVQDDLLSSKKLRALLFVREPEEYVKILADARTILAKGLKQLKEDMESGELDFAELLKAMTMANKVTRDFVNIAEVLRKGVNEDQVVRALTTQLRKVEEAYKEITDGKEVETERATGNRMLPSPILDDQGPGTSENGSDRSVLEDGEAAFDDPFRGHGS